MKKKLYLFLLSLVMVAAMLTGCGSSGSIAEGETEAEESTQAEDMKKKETITIVYTNDIHGFIANIKAKTSKDDPDEAGLRLSKVSQLVKDLRAEGQNVLLVDAGDQIQGCSYSAIDEGESIIKLMNAAGYQLATFGNHEFDYGANTFFQRIDQADYPYISCNFHTLEESATRDPLDATQIYEFGDTKVAFVGISTPETITSSTPAYFQDSKGNYIYSIDGLDDPEDLYQSVQAAIDSVRDQVDYVIALGHNGVAEKSIKAEVSSIDIIAHTSGLDAYIDGHSHTAIEDEFYEDKDGHDVVLTQSGYALAHVGVMTIREDGEISSRLLDDYEGVDEEVAAAEEKLIGQVDQEYGKKIAALDTDLDILNPDNHNQMLIRSREMNCGDFIADSIYWYFNEEKKLDCDVAFMNGAGIRNSIEAGDITLNDVKTCLPYGNMICLIQATGQQIRDALELGVTLVDVWNDTWDAPETNGGFLQVAGIRYQVDATIPSSVQKDSNHIFQSVTGEYRVKDIEVYNRETNSYEALEPDKTYTVASIDFLLHNSGCGYSMFKDCDTVADYVARDMDVLADYMESFTEEDGYPRIRTENSPLASYPSYLIDYENPRGSGRIQMTGVRED